MGQYTKADAMRIISKCAVQYNTHLLGHSLLFLIMDKHKNISSLEVCFEKRNFLHLTGLEVDKSVFSGERFFEACIEKKLRLCDFELRDDGTTELKLDILPYLMTKNLSANAVGDYNGVGIDLYTEKIAGSVKGCIGFCVDKMTGSFVPNTVLKKDIRMCTKKPQKRIIATYRKLTDSESYSEVVYVAKKLDFSALKFPDEYNDLKSLIHRNH